MNNTFLQIALGGWVYLKSNERMFEGGVGSRYQRSTPVGREVTMSGREEYRSNERDLKGGHTLTVPATLELQR